MQFHKRILKFFEDVCEQTVWMRQRTAKFC